MKRISLRLVALLCLTPGVTQAWYYSSYCYGVRYSPYAFSYRHSGLVYGVDYTPYAYNYRNSGLVPGYGCSGAYSDYSVPVFGGRFARGSRPAFRGSHSVRRHAQDTSQPVRPQDGMEIIRRHLTAKGIKSASLDRVLRIDDQLVSADFLLKDRNLLIKYWNPEAIESIGTKEGFQQKAYEKYRQDWTRIAAQHEQNGGQVYYVQASDAQAIVAALDACTGLDARPGTPGRPVMYAKD